MAKLKQSTEVIDLGKKIVEEFSRDERPDTTTRWISHYLAEQISKLEHAKSLNDKRKIERECVSLILQLWNNRQYFPPGTAPLSKLTGVLSILQSLVDDEGGAPWDRFADYHENRSPWARFMKKLAEDFRTMTELSLSTAASMNVLLREKEWLKLEKFLSDEEKAILKHIDRLLARETGPFRVVYITSDPKDIKKDELESRSKLMEIFDKMEALISSQAKELNSLKQEILAIERFTKRSDEKAPTKMKTKKVFKKKSLNTKQTKSIKKRKK